MSEVQQQGKRYCQACPLSTLAAVSPLTLGALSLSNPMLHAGLPTCEGKMREREPKAEVSVRSLWWCDTYSEDKENDMAAANGHER